MSADAEHERNQQAYRQLAEHIKKSYAAGRFVGIAGGKIIADGATFAELESELERMQQNSRDVLVVQAGVGYPEQVVIVALGMTQGFGISAVPSAANAK